MKLNSNKMVKWIISCNNFVSSKLWAMFIVFICVIFGCSNKSDDKFRDDSLSPNKKGEWKINGPHGNEIAFLKEVWIDSSNKRTILGYISLNKDTLVKEEYLNDVLVYRVYPSTKGNDQTGEALFNYFCSSCHHAEKNLTAKPISQNISNDLVVKYVLNGFENHIKINKLSKSEIESITSFINSGYVKTH